MKLKISLPRSQQHAFCLILSHIQRTRPSPGVCVTFPNMLASYGKQLVSPSSKI